MQQMTFLPRRGKAQTPVWAADSVGRKCCFRKAVDSDPAPPLRTVGVKLGRLAFSSLFYESLAERQEATDGSHF